MKRVIKLIILLLVFSQTSFSQKRQYGNYFNKWRYWGAMYTLNADSTFKYTLRTNAGAVTTTNQTEFGTSTTTSDSYIFADSSHGTYHIINDTVFLNYSTPEIPGDFNDFNMRPKKLYWKGKSLYYIDSQTNNVIRQKEYYMKWSKYRNPNLPGLHNLLIAISF